MKAIKLFLVTALVMLATGQACWASSTYYFSVTAQVGSGEGKVYVSDNPEDTPQYSEDGNTSNTSAQGPRDSSASKTFYLFAQPNDGYKLSGWKIGDETFTTQANPFEKMLTSNKTNSREKYTCSAIFVAEHSPYLAYETLTYSIVKGDTWTNTLTQEYITETVRYTSSDTNVATVDADGMVTGVKEGSATITASANGVSASYTIRVDDPNAHLAYYTVQTTGGVTTIPATCQAYIKNNKLNVKNITIAGSTQNYEISISKQNDGSFKPSQDVGVSLTAWDNGDNAICDITMDGAHIVIAPVLEIGKESDIVTNEATYKGLHNYKYTRTLKQGWNTIGLPFDWSADDFGGLVEEVREFGGVKNEGETLIFSPVSNTKNLKAHQPYLIKLKEAISTPFYFGAKINSVAPTSVKQGDWYYIARYNKYVVTGSESSTFYGIVNKGLDDTSFIQAGAGASFGCTVGVFEYKGAAFAPDLMNIGLDDSTVGIVEAHRAATGNDKVYDLSGRRTKAKGQGVYVVGGKKIIK